MKKNWYLILFWFKFKAYKFKLVKEPYMFRLYFKNLKDVPYLSFWVHDTGFYYMEFAKQNKKTYDLITLKTFNYNFKEGMNFLNNFIPLFVQQYQYLYDEDITKMENRLEPLITQIQRKDLIDELVE